MPTPTPPPGAAPAGTPAPPQRPLPPQAPVAVGKAPIAPDDPEPGAGRGLPMPQEREQSVGTVASEPDPIIEQAARDIAAGQVDTDLRNTGGQTHERREELLRREREPGSR